MSMDRSNWKTDVQFIPTIWMHPLAKDQAGCAAAVGNQIVGTIQSYQKTKNNQGGDSNFFSFLLAESTIPEAQVYVPGEGGREGTYVPTPFIPNEFYSIRAPGNLFHQLKKYATDPSFTGVPLEITYKGLKEIETDSTDKQGKPIRIKTLAHQYQVRRDPSWEALPNARPIMLLEGPAGGEG